MSAQAKFTKIHKQCPACGHWPQYMCGICKYIIAEVNGEYIIAEVIAITSLRVEMHFNHF